MWRTVQRFFKKLKIELPYDPAVPLWGIHSDTYTPMFITAPFTIARIWKQPRCPWTDEWTKKIHKHNGIFLSHKEEQSWVICRDMDEPRDCHTK